MSKKLLKYNNKSQQWQNDRNGYCSLILFYLILLKQLPDSLRKENNIQYNDCQSIRQAFILECI